MAKIFTYRGKTAEELQKMGTKEVAALLPARARRSLLRGISELQKKLLKKVKLAKAGQLKKDIRTHCRDMWIVPEMFGITIGVHDGKQFVPVAITPEMIGHSLGEFVTPTKEVKHAAPGIGATRGSKFVSVK